MIDISISLIIGLIIFYIAIVSLVKKRFTLDIGRNGFFRPKPIFTVTLTENRALLFGAISLIVGIVLIGISICGYLVSGMIVQETLTIMIFISVSIVIFVFLLSLFLEFLVWLRNNSPNRP